MSIKLIFYSNSKDGVLNQKGTIELNYVVTVKFVLGEIRGEIV